MPPRRVPGLGQRARGRLVCLAVVVLAAAGISTYKAIGGGGSRSGAHTAADAPQAAIIEGGKEAIGGGVRGNEGQPNKGGGGAEPVVPDGGDAAGAGEPPIKKNPAEGEVAAGLPTKKGKVEVFEETEDGGFLPKVGQIRVKTSESLDFSTEDTVPGSMWLPIALRDVATGDPWVTMCLIDYEHYQKSMADEGRAPLPPKGFIYHETRCGSTLVANMLATLAPSRVFSESKPPTQTIRECLTAGCDRHLLVKMFRNTMALMGRRRNGEQHEHLYFKFQNSKQISEAYPEVPWVFVFRDPVEVMVSNLKSYAGAPCVRIPRQEKLRKQASRKFKKLGGGGEPAMLKSKAARDAAALQKTRPKFGRGRGRGSEPWGREPEGVRGGGKRSRSLVEAAVVLGGSAPGEGVTATANGVAAGGGGGGDDAFSERDTGVVVWEEEEEEEEVEDGDSDFYASVSWSGGISGGIESSDLPLYPAAYSSAALFEPSPWESAAFGADERRRSLATKKTGQMLTMNMTMECANWLQAMCAFALAAEKETPSKALFVDYANLPDAVPEYVFPQHFGMEAEVAETVPDWKDRMFEAAGSYSKGLGKRTKEFTNDVKEKHKDASPLIVEASEKDGGLYEVYRSLEVMQSWRRPDSEEAHH
ncbi:conserved unknown protein [Ectocarpus siliculosus]|uniref:Sulfotransferase domain-containing protein n=1 Tax=Ectocarpus siliculosus TaxID=2880 RepID=D7FTH5_ECTSI|nr:conserved unknown protein [Ectocarpus siliculosus]|eukprot:CBJ48553.1 conserved unknown protein [Ectocarpus siliculosus]